jgi:hypothetical protein
VRLRRVKGKALRAKGAKGKALRAKGQKAKASPEGATFLSRRCKPAVKKSKKGKGKPRRVDIS